MRPALACCLASLLLATSTGAQAVTVDPYLWLEDVEGNKALDWVRAQNSQSQKVLATDPGPQRSYRGVSGVGFAEVDVDGRHVTGLEPLAQPLGTFNRV